MVKDMPTTYETSQGDEPSTPPPADQVQGLQDDAKALLDSAREQGSAKFEEYRGTAADQLENLAQTAQSAAEQLQENDTLGLSHYVTDVAQSMTSLADNLRNKSAEQLLQQAGQLARDNPALFITGSIALGFGLSRFLRASKPDLSANASSSDDSDRQGSPGNSSRSGYANTAGFDSQAPTSRASAQYPGGPPPYGDITQAGTAPSAENSSEDAGIKPSGVELGGFARNDNFTASSTPGSQPDSVSPGQPAPKTQGEV